MTPPAVGSEPSSTPLDAPVLPFGWERDPATSAVRLPLSGGGFALIDAELVPQVMGSCWALNRGGYPLRKLPGGQRQLLHHLVLPRPAVGLVDHINGDRRDARRCNLRCGDQHTNQWNQRKVRSASGYKGVTCYQQAGRYQAALMYRGTLYYLGLYRDPTNAARAYWLAAEALFGDFAWSNLPEGEREIPSTDEGRRIVRHVERTLARVATRSTPATPPRGGVASCAA